ncbi:MAG: hypothetical protein FOGNACKC_02326 [Anaerolineae bacterium]|nr:hypothetical protein [Anaerolineae bacterium]
MTAKCMCPTDTLGTDQIYVQINANQKGETTVWNGLKWLAETIGAYAVEVYRYSNNPDPVFSNGGTRVLIRPDRIDLV